MNIVALYKTFDGEEFVEASLDSIYEHVDAIVMVHSAISWGGIHGNTVYPIAEAWAERHDCARKLHHVHIDSGTQEDQYRAGLEYIASASLAYDVVMAIDVDEVWDDDNFRRAIEAMEAEPDKPCYTPRMHTYLKSVFYQIDPPWGQPTVFLRKPELLLESARAWNTPDAGRLDTVYFHHFCLVRNRQELIARKIVASAQADGGEPTLDSAEWFGAKWHKLPNSENLHPFAGREHLWERVTPVWLDNLPRSVVQNPGIMRHYLPPGELTEADERTLWTLAKDKKCCVDLGTFLGRSAVLLSLRAKKVLTIDLFEHCPREAESSPGHGYRGMAAKHNLRAGAVRKWLSLYSNIDVAQVDTGSAELAADGSVDLVFIDDDHSYQGVAWDFWAWLPKLKRGGIVAFHDVNDWHPPVQKFVKRLEKERLDMIALPLGDTPSSIRAFRKASA